MKTTISKSFEFCMAHRIPNHNGKCKNLHGHNYKCTIFIKGKINEETGMVVDFSEINPLIDAIKTFFDHKAVFYYLDPLLQSFGARYHMDKSYLFNELGLMTCELHDSICRPFPDSTISIEPGIDHGFGTHAFYELPTAENLAKVFANFITAKLNYKFKVKVELYETEKCQATVKGVN